jgi:hypothetical protein
MPVSGSPLEGREVHRADLDKWQAFGSECEAVDTILPSMTSTGPAPYWGTSAAIQAAERKSSRSSSRVGFFVGTSRRPTP